MSDRVMDWLVTWNCCDVLNSNGQQNGALCASKCVHSQTLDQETVQYLGNGADSITHHISN